MKGKMKSAMMAMTLKNADYQRQSVLEKNFKFKKRRTDPRFGDISIIQNPKTGSLLAVRERKITNKKEAGRQIINCRKRMNNKNPNILNLTDYSITKQSELCSSFYILKEFYEYPKSDLKREILMRGKQGDTLNDTELTHIMYQQILANSYLEAKDQNHGDIQPLNIAYDKKSMQSKLIDISHDRQTQNKSRNIQKNRLIRGNQIYQSPIMYQNLKKGNLNFDVDPSKEDTYALGLTLLEAGNGKSIQNIYDKDKGEVDQQALQGHLNEFNQKHGHNKVLARAVNEMIQPDEANRTNFRGLESSLPDYDQMKQILVNRNVHGGVNPVPMTNYSNYDQDKYDPFDFTKFNSDIYQSQTNYKPQSFQNIEQPKEVQAQNFNLVPRPPSRPNVQSNPDKLLGPTKSEIPRENYNQNYQEPIEINVSEENPYMYNKPEEKMVQNAMPVQTNSYYQNPPQTIVQQTLPVHTETYTQQYVPQQYTNVYTPQEHYTNVQNSQQTYHYAPPSYSERYVQSNPHNYVYQSQKYITPVNNSTTLNSTQQSNYLTDSRRQVVTLEPEYRTEYINKVDPVHESQKLSQKYTNQNFVVKNEPIVQRVSQQSYNQIPTNQFAVTSDQKPISNVKTINQNHVTNFNTSGLKLIRTYEDPKFATRKL